jgi:hypothetical protein
VTADELAQALAKVDEAPLAQFAFPCPRCSARLPGTPEMAYGYYTADGLQRHLVEFHDEARP